MCALVAALILASLGGAARAAEPAVRLKLESYRKGVAARITVGGKQRLFQLDTAGGVTAMA